MSIPSRALLASCLVLGLAAAAHGEPARPNPRPATASASPHLSLKGLVPSPEPSHLLPKMPRPVAGRFVFYDDFEKSMDKWQALGGKDGVGWFRIESKSCGGLFTMVIGHKDNSAFKGVRTQAYLQTSQPIDLKKIKKPQLQYDLKGITRPFETIKITIEARRPGGRWKNIGATATARYPAVVTYTADLNPYAGGLAELRFVGTVNAGSASNKGMFLDDVHVVEPN